MFHSSPHPMRSQYLILRHGKCSGDVWNSRSPGMNPNMELQVLYVNGFMGFS
jgi:hypothetical protein